MDAGIRSDRIFQMAKILIVEDEAHIAEGLKFNLTEEGFEPTVVDSGEKALEELDSGSFEAIVLDIMLPGISGFDVARSLREAENYTPILMLTARGRPEDVLEGFAAGTDDYLPKPFELEIFLARLRGLLRRKQWSQTESEPTQTEFDIGGKQFDFGNLEIRTGTETIKLTLMEAKLLRHLIVKNGQAVSRKEILEEVWGLNEETDTRAIDNFIVRLRRYVEDDPARPEILQTVRGIGYRLKIED